MLDRRRWFVFLLGFLVAYPVVFTASAGAQTTATNEWTWMGGSNSSGGYGALSPPGVYGTLGTPAATNIPGFRWGLRTGLIVAGISGYSGAMALMPMETTAISTTCGSSILPRANGIWMSGNSTFGQSIQYCEGYDCGRAGVYGTLGTPGPGNMPGGRTKAASWTDSNGNFWLFGGDGFDGTGDYEFGACQLNDMWMYNPATSEWVWTGGKQHVRWLPRR